MAFYTMHIHYLQLVFLMLVACLQMVDAFSPRNNSLLSERNRISLAFLSRSKQRVALISREAVHTNTVGEDFDRASLVIRADYVAESEPAPVTSQEAMLHFFRDNVNRNCLVSAGNTREAHTTPTTDDLLQRWKERASSLGAEEPEASDTIVSVRIGGMQFPGVQLESISLIGTKLLAPPPSNDLPSYEFVLIQDKREATGLPPLVWIYNTLTGKGEKDREKDTTPRSLSRVTIQRKDHGKSVTFKIVTFLEIRVNFPVILLSILPVKKEKAEAQGSEAVSTVLRKDLDRAMRTFRDTYVASLQSN